MPDTTNEDAESGFMGLTVVPARLNEAVPNPIMTTPATATVTEKKRCAGNMSPNAGMAREANHISAAMRRPTAGGGIFNSSTCMASAPRQNVTQEARGRMELFLALGGAERGQGFGYFAAFGFDQVQEFFGGAGIFSALGVGIDRLEIVILLLDRLARDRPASLTVSTG